jgi:nitrate reductase gamma subunit
LLQGEVRLALKIWGNASGLVLFVGLLLSLARRLVRRAGPAGETGGSDTPLVLFLLWLTLSGFLLEYLRLLAAASAAAAGQLRPWLTALWTTHGLSGVALVAWLPRSTLLHAVLAPLVIALNARPEHARRDLSWPDTTNGKANGSRKG